MKAEDKRINGDPAPIEILFEKGKHINGVPSDWIRNEESAKKAAQTLFEAFNDPPGIQATAPRRASRGEWSFDAGFMNGVLHCSVTRGLKENAVRFRLTNWTPEIWRELETKIPAVFGALKNGRFASTEFTVLCEVRDADDPQKKILWVESALSYEKEKHTFESQLAVIYKDPENKEQTALPDRDDMEYYNQVVKNYGMFRNDRFSVFLTEDSAWFVGYIVRDWCALAVSDHGALYMVADYDEPWETDYMLATEMTDAFVEDILYAYELRYKRKMKCTSLSYGTSGYSHILDGKICCMTIEPVASESEA